MKSLSVGKTVTLEDIARAAGCSKNTVSLALRNSRRISAPLRNRIRGLAETMQYIPDYAARNLRVQRSGLIGVYTHALQDAVRTEMVNHLLAELHTAEYRPVLGLGQGSREPWHASPWMQTFRELRVEALVVLWSHVYDLPDWSRSIPIIMVGGDPAENLPCDYLALDRKQAGAMGTEHLLSRGHRRVLIAAPTEGDFYQGCLQTLGDARCKPYLPPYRPDFSDLQQARIFGHTLARQKDPPNAALFVDSGYAATFLRGVLDARRRVPQDIAIVGYDYFPWAEMLAVPLTTVEQPIGTLASAAVELIRRRLANPDSPPTHMVQPHTLVIRGSS
jgi:LacI family transcriptional regulator